VVASLSVRNSWIRTPVFAVTRSVGIVTVIFPTPLPPDMTLLSGTLTEERWMRPPASVHSYVATYW
jgi:hypothetical protein